MVARSPRATLVVGGADVRRLVPMRDCLPVVRRTMQAVSRGDSMLPLRVGTGTPCGTLAVAAMPGWIGDPRSVGAKLICVSRDNSARGLPSHQGIVVLFDPDDGLPLAIVDASSVTALRTAAASAIATDVLARADARSLGILGTGAQAQSHIEALALVRDLRDIRVWGRTPDKATAFAESESVRLGLRVRAVPTARDAVEGADIVATTTASREPILHGDWLAPGTHVNLVGASSRAAREADDAAVKGSLFFVDHRPAALDQAGELLHAMRERAAEFIVAEIGEVLNGTASGRGRADQITIYKSLGIAAQDLAIAHEVLSRARAAGAGTAVAL